MSYSFEKQNVYQAPIDGLFIVKIHNNDISYQDIIGSEFVLDFQTYKVATIMQDVPTGEYFALCKLLIIPQSDIIE